MGGRAKSRLFSAPRASVCANCNGVYLVEFWKQPHLPDIGATSSMILRPKANDTNVGRTCICARLRQPPTIYEHHPRDGEHRRADEADVG